VKFRVEYKPARIFDVPELVLDVSRARYHLNWSPKIPLEQGIARTWEWVKTLVIN